jgi:DNA-binding CsgD family transcriptional regulator
MAAPPREQDSAPWVMWGRPDKKIACELQISITTMRTHLDKAFRKVRVSSGAALVHGLGP